MINKDYSQIVLDRTPLKLSRVKLIVWHFNWTNVKVALLCKSIYCFSFLFSHLTSVILLFLFYLSVICAVNLSTTILSFPSKTLPPFVLFPLPFPSISSLLCPYFPIPNLYLPSVLSHLLLLYLVTILSSTFSFVFTAHGGFYYISYTGLQCDLPPLRPHCGESPGWDSNPGRAI